jgi:NTE family protein
VTTRALVLGGGGVTGVAWEIGLLAGLAARGVQLGVADLIVGTSAGSVVGAQLACGTNLDQMYADQLQPPEERPPGSADVARLRLRHIALYAWAALRHRDPVQARARIGRLATTARTMPEAERRAVIAARVPGDDWPARQLLITAVDAGSGEFRAFEAGQGVELIDAVAASCAVPGVWPPVTIDGRRWMDGGMRSPANADLAAGCDAVVVLAPVTQGLRGSSVPSQVAALRQRGRAVAVVWPDRAAKAAIGRNVLDPARRAPAARAGHAQSGSALDRVAAVWG